jgi:signal transduction histidine kinase
MVKKSILLSIVMVALYCSPGNDPVPKAKNGVIDLQEYDFVSKDSIPLGGEWNFFSNDWEPSSDGDIIHVPSTWNHKMEHQGMGYGTYRLKVLLPNKRPKLALQVNDISTSFQLWINGELLHEKGKIGTNKEEMVPSYKRPIIILEDSDKDIVIDVKIANYYHPKGGMRSPIEIGNFYTILDHRKVESAIAWIVVGSTLLMGIYHFVIFFMRRIDLSALWFGLFCFLAGIRALFDKTFFFYEVLPDSAWASIHKFDVFSFGLALPILSLFLYSIFPQDFHKRILNLLISVGILFSLIVAIFPITVYLVALNYFEIFIFFAIIYFCYLIIITLQKKREGSILFLVGSLFLFAATINDILNQMRLIYTGYYANWGLIAFIFSQTTALSKRFSSAYVHLEELKKSLEKKVLQRTSELNIAKKKAEDANHLKDKFISLVSHDLRSPIASVIGLLSLLVEDYNDMEDEEKLDFINKALTSSTHSLEMIAQLLNMNRLRLGTIQVEYEHFNIHIEVEQVIERLWLQWNQKKIKFFNKIPSLTFINSDKSLLNEVIFNLISNAIKFSNEEDSITIELEDNPEYWIFKITDRGVGIPPDTIPNLFRVDLRTSTKGTKGEAGTGLGLPFVKDILDAMKGSITVYSVPGEGSSFHFQVPKKFPDNYE